MNLSLTSSLMRARRISNTTCGFFCELLRSNPWLARGLLRSAVGVGLV